MAVAARASAHACTGFSSGQSYLTGARSSSIRAFPSALRPSLPSLVSKSRRSAGITCDGGPNFFVELLGSTFGAGVVTAVTLATSEDREKAIEKVQTVEGAIPYAAALGADTIAHSLPLLNVLVSLATEPVGAAAGVAYLFSIVLSSPAVDPNTLAPAGTVLNAEKVKDIRGSVRVPFTKIFPTLLKVVDFSNEFSSGKGWTTGADGLPKLPITSVIAVIAVGTLLLELLGHAPILGIFLPRVFQVAGWVAAIGYILDKREEGTTAV